MKVDISPELGEKIAVAYLKELYVNLVADDTKDRSQTAYVDHVARMKDMSAVLHLLKQLLPEEEYKAFLKETHDRYYP